MQCFGCKTKVLFRRELAGGDLESAARLLESQGDEPELIGRITDTSAHPAGIDHCLISI